MAAPKGNQYAKGNPNSGRPLKHDLEKEARDLLEWSLRGDALRLYGFTDDKEYCVSDLPGFAKQNQVFRNALKKAKERLANRREDYRNRDMICSIVYSRTQHIYDNECTDEDDVAKDKDLNRKIKLLEHEIKLKKEMEASKGIPPNDITLTEMLKEIKQMKGK